MRIPPSGPTGPRRPRGSGRWLALAAGAMVSAAVLPGVAGMVSLAVAVLALLTACVFSVRAQWVALLAEDAVTAQAVDGDAAAELSRRLRRLRDEHVARVDAALDEGRPEAARRLTDAYIDAGLRAITDGADART